MRPAVIEQLADLPRLATGKPDRRRLPAVTRARRQEAGYLPPQRLAEQQLVRIWEELLAARPIGIRDNFFHLGGHSLLAVQLVDRIERVYGHEAAPVHAVRQPDDRAAGRGGARQRSCGGRKGPGAAGAGARPPEAVLLPARGLDRRASSVSTWPGPAGRTSPSTRWSRISFSGDEGTLPLEAIAEAHIAAMRGVQPHGPYRLGGFCNGGLLAYEMARQLEARGEQVEFLGLINPSEPVQASHGAGGMRTAGPPRAPGRWRGRPTCTCGCGMRNGTSTGGCGRAAPGCGTSASCWPSSPG